MNRKQEQKVKPFQNLRQKHGCIAEHGSFELRCTFEDQGYVKVKAFPPVNETSRQKGIGSENMWVKITESDVKKV